MIIKLNYYSHLLLNFKNKALLTIFMQLGIVIILTQVNDINNAFCMTNDSVSDQVSEISSIFDYDDAYMDHCVGPLLEHVTDTFTQYSLNNIEETSSLLNPMFEYLKSDDPRYIENLSSFDNKELLEKIKVLQNAYFSESISHAVLDDALNKQTDQLYRRHEALLESRETVKALTKENLELKNQVEELERLLKDSLK